MSDTDTHVETVADLLGEYATVEGQMDWLAARKAELRQRLSAHLYDEYHRDGALPTKRVKGLGSAWLAGGEPKARITDPDAWATWAAEHYPDQVEMVIYVPMTRVHSEDFGRAWNRLQPLSSETGNRVAHGLLDVVTTGGALDLAARVLVTAEGEKVSGVAVVTSEPTLYVKASPEAKRTAIEASLTTREAGL